MSVTRYIAKAATKDARDIRTYVANKMLSTLAASDAAAAAAAVALLLELGPAGLPPLEAMATRVDPRVDEIIH